MTYSKRHDRYFPHNLRFKNTQYITQWSIDMLWVFLIQMTQNRVQLTARWWILWFCCYSKITLHFVNSTSLCVKGHLPNIWITNTNLDKQGTWASFSRWFWDMCIQATWGRHCVQTEDVGGVLWKQNKHQEGSRSKVQGKEVPVHAVWRLGTTFILNFDTRLRYEGSFKP